MRSVVRLCRKLHNGRAGSSSVAMDGALRAVVEAIHSKPTKAVLYLAGGASQTVGWLLSVPGASNTVLEVKIPYARSSMIQMLGKPPARFVSRETAEQLALVAYNRALALSLPGVPVAGVGLVAALVSTSPKKGDHRCHISARTQSANWSCSVTLSKGLRDRVAEDELTSRLVLKTLADACGLSSDLPIGLDQEDEVLFQSRENFSEDVQLDQLVSGATCMMKYPGSRDSQGEGRKVVLSGSFNPVHDGHLKLMDIACSLCSGGMPCFELAVVNADKPPLSHDETRRRIMFFQERGRTIVVTNQPFFFKKADLFPDSTFVVGVDTAVRLVNPKYYDGSEKMMLEALCAMRQSGCDFLVAGRKAGSGFQTLKDVSIPEEVRSMFREIPADMFREDISSTELRQRSGG